MVYLQCGKPEQNLPSADCSYPLSNSSDIWGINSNINYSFYIIVNFTVFNLVCVFENLLIIPHWPDSISFTSTNLIYSLRFPSELVCRYFAII